jgi:hypothetical protein
VVDRVINDRLDSGNAQAVHGLPGRVHSSSIGALRASISTWACSVPSPQLWVEPQITRDVSLTLYALNESVYGGNRPEA